MRRSTLYALLAIAVLTAVAVWIALPGERNVLGRQARLVEGLDLQGGLQVLLKAAPAKGQHVNDQVMNDLKQIVENRVNGLGVSEPLVQTQGSDYIVVELPGIKDPDQAIKTLQGTGLLEFVDTGTQSLAPGTLVNTTLGPASSANPSASTTPAATTTPQPSSTAAGKAGLKPRSTPGPSATTTPAATKAPAVGQTGSGSSGQSANGPVYRTILTGKDIKSANPGFDPQTNAPVVEFTLTSDGAKKFADYTSSHVGQYLTIVLDKRVISSPQIKSPITQGNGEITGVSQAEAQSLAVQLRYGALPVPLRVASSNNVGSTLGADSVSRSITAGAIGVIAVALFMILFYRLPGLVSVIALGVYGSIVFATFKLIPVTLTLAGIAGFVLSVGMAVDANVLIFSRMKEELRRGRGLLQSVDMGFRNAWPSIRDSNVSTLITCAILIWFGSHFGASIIQGFAFTLAIGVLVSMFSAIMVTRTLLQVVVALPGIRRIWLWGVNKDQVGGMSGSPRAGTALGGTRPR